MRFGRSCIFSKSETFQVKIKILTTYSWFFRVTRMANISFVELRIEPQLGCLFQWFERELYGVGNPLLVVYPTHN